MPARATSRPDNRLFLGASLQSRDGTLTKDALITNGFIEAKKEESMVYKRGGLNLVAALGSGAGQGIVNYTNSDGTEVLYAVLAGAAYISNVPTIGGAWALSNSYSSGSVVFSFGGYIWQVGGDNFPSNSYYASTIPGTQTLAANNVWALGVGTGRSYQAPLVIGAAVYLLGGNGSGSVAATKAEVWKTTDGANFTQVTAAAGFGAKTYVKAGFVGTTLFYLGGQDSAGTYDNAVYSSVDNGANWSLVTATPSWGGAGAALRTGYAVTSFAGKLWVTGGVVNSVKKNDVWYSTDGSTWTQATASAAWAIRSAHFLTTIAGGAVMALMGGYNASGGQLTDTYSSIDGITWTAGSAITGSAPIGSIYNLAGTHRGFPWTTTINLGLYYSTGTGTATGTSLGAISVGPNDMVDFAKNLDGSQIMLKSSTAAYKLVPATGIITQVTDTDYPTTTVRGNPYLDGTFYVLTPGGQIYGSADEDCTSWTATNKVTAEFEPDSGVCLGKYNNYIVAFGQWTTQMFWDAAVAAPASALLPVQNGVLLIGCAHANSVSQVEATILWIAQRKGQGSSFQKGRFIAMLEGQSYVRVSTADVDRVLDADDLAIVYSCVGSFAGHNFYILSLGTTGASLVYDMTQKVWYVWTQCAVGSNRSVSAITQVNGLATATSASHGFSDGDPITISGANQAGYNLTGVNITYVDANTFTYPVASATVSPATGTILATPVTESYFSVCASCNFGGQQVFQAVSGGNIYSLLDSIFQDNSQPINFKIRTSNQDLDTNNRKFCTEVTPLCDMTASASTGLLRKTDDDYQTNSAYRRFDISDVTPRAQRWGNYRRRGWEWRYTQNTRHRISALEIDQFREDE